MIRTKKRNTSVFLRAYTIFVGICILLAIVFLIYVACVVSNYDSAQPEKLLDRKMAELKDDAISGALIEKLSDFNAGSEKYENINGRVIRNSYADLIKKSSLTYEIKAGAGKDLTKTYNVFADGKPVGSITLKGENDRNELFFFSYADWSVESFIPFLTDTEYNLKLYVPDGFTLKINGISPDSTELIKDESETAYQISGLVELPKIEYTDKDGKEVTYIIDNNVVTPLPYQFCFSLPKGITVSVNGSDAEGSEMSDGQLSYEINELYQPVIILRDCGGNELLYSGETSIDISYRRINIPEGFSISVNGNVLDTKLAEVSDNPDEKLLFELVGAKLPKTLSYDIPVLKNDISAVITDRNGVSKEYALTDNALNISGNFSSEPIPADIAEEIDVLYAAECWSKFMSNDLEGDKNGFVTIADYLIFNSDYYNNARDWALGIDITFTSTHELTGFRNESVSNFVRYNENCFSCDVYFEKDMTLYAYGTYAGDRTDIFNSTMYFVKYDDTAYDGTDDPHWLIAVMRDVQ